VKKGIFSAAAAACALALLGLGCGGGDGSDEVTASSISKSEYIKQASAVCEGAAKRIKTDFGVYTREHAGDKSGADTAELFEAVFLPNAEQEIDELRELGAPEGDVKTVEAMLSAREDALTKVQANPKSGLTNKPFEKSIKAAEDYGVIACAIP
jgi:hypothetical protein